MTGAAYISRAETQLGSLSNSLGSNQQRLRRYISDINRGRWIIIASGKHEAMMLASIVGCNPMLHDILITCVLCDNFPEGLTYRACKCVTYCKRLALQSAIAEM